MNKYFLLLLLVPHFNFAGKEADDVNFKSMSVARLSQENNTPVAPLVLALYQPNYVLAHHLLPQLHFEFNYKQARNKAPNIELTCNI